MAKAKEKAFITAYEKTGLEVSNALLGSIHFTNDMKELHLVSGKTKKTSNTPYSTKVLHVDFFLDAYGVPLDISNESITIDDIQYLQVYNTFQLNGLYVKSELSAKSRNVHETVLSQTKFTGPTPDLSTSPVWTGTDIHGIDSVMYVFNDISTGSRGSSRGLFHSSWFLCSPCGILCSTHCNSSKSKLQTKLDLVLKKVLRMWDTP